MSGVLFVWKKSRISMCYMIWLLSCILRHTRAPHSEKHWRKAYLIGWSRIDIDNKIIQELTSQGLQSEPSFSEISSLQQLKCQNLLWLIKSFFVWFLIISLMKISTFLVYICFFTLQRKKLTHHVPTYSPRQGNRGSEWQ